MKTLLRILQPAADAVIDVVNFLSAHPRTIVRIVLELTVYLGFMAIGSALTGLTANQTCFVLFISIFTYCMLFRVDHDNVDHDDEPKGS